MRAPASAPRASFTDPVPACRGKVTARYRARESERQRQTELERRRDGQAERKRGTGRQAGRQSGREEETATETDSAGERGLSFAALLAKRAFLAAVFSSCCSSSSDVVSPSDTTPCCAAHRHARGCVSVPPRLSSLPRARRPPHLVQEAAQLRSQIALILQRTLEPSQPSHHSWLLRPGFVLLLRARRHILRLNLY